MQMRAQLLMDAISVLALLFSYLFIFLSFEFVFRTRETQTFAFFRGGAMRSAGHHRRIEKQERNAYEDVRCL